MPEICVRCNPPDAPEADIDPPPDGHRLTISEALSREVERLRAENERLRAGAVSAVSRLSAMGDFPDANDLVATRELLAVAVYGEAIEVGPEPEKGTRDGP